jgi:hypothetical protein
MVNLLKIKYKAYLYIAFMLEVDTVNATIKKSRKYVCEKCNYITYKISNYKQHLNTNKHKQLENARIKKSSILRCLCGKNYKHLSSYYRHKKTCDYVLNENKEEQINEEINEEDKKEEDKNEKVDYKDLFVKMLSQNKDLQDLLIKQIKDLKILFYT